MITSDDPLEPKVGQTFSYLIPASDDAKSFGATDLPAGLSLDPMTGVISGTPTTVGNYTVTLSASNDNGTANQTLILDVKLPKAPAITSMPTTTATVDQPCFHYITASDEPKSFSATDLPAGLSLDPKTGEISGTPTSAGTYMITLSASNEIGAGSQTFTITVLPYIPVIMSPDTVTVTVGQPLSHTITADNAPTFYAAANLPPGLSLNAVTGEISGKPTTVGTYTIMLSSSNDKGTGSQTLTLSVTLPPEIRITYYVDLTGFVLSVQGEENQEYGVEYTTDFQQWIPLEFKILGEMDLFVVDPRAMDSPYRFYRVIRR